MWDSTDSRHVSLWRHKCPCEVMVVNTKARSLAFALQFPDPCLSGVNPRLQPQKACLLPWALRQSDTFDPSTAVLQHTEQKKKTKTQRWQIFHAYDIRATVHPPPLTQKRKRHACVCVCVWRWITRSHLEERGIWAGSNFRRKPLRASRVGGGEEYRCSFGATTLFSCQTLQTASHSPFSWVRIKIHVLALN